MSNQPIEFRFASARQMSILIKTSMFAAVNFDCFPPKFRKPEGNVKMFLKLDFFVLFCFVLKYFQFRTK